MREVNSFRSTWSPFGCLPKLYLRITSVLQGESALSGRNAEAPVHGGAEWRHAQRASGGNGVSKPEQGPSALLTINLALLVRFRVHCVAMLQQGALRRDRVKRLLGDRSLPGQGGEGVGPMLGDGVRAT